VGEHSDHRHHGRGWGYYHTGDVQPLDFFGDGTRFPTIVISP
jgi:phospholipase C